MKLVLLWDTKNDDGIRLFLHEAWEAYAKVSSVPPSATFKETEICSDYLQYALNPFYELNGPVKSRSFDAKIRASARKHL